MSAAEVDESNPESIISHFKKMNAECQQIQSKVTELTLEKEEHRLVEQTLSKLDGDRKAYRLVGGVLVERTVGEVLPIVSKNLEGISQILETLQQNLKKRDAETKAFKDKHQIMTQQEREARMRAQQRQQQLKS